MLFERFRGDIFWVLLRVSSELGAADRRLAGAAPGGNAGGRRVVGAGSPPAGGAVDVRPMATGPARPPRTCRVQRLCELRNECVTTGTVPGQRPFGQVWRGRHGFGTKAVSALTRAAGRERIGRVSGDETIQLAEGAWCLGQKDGGRGHAFLLDDGEELTLVD